MCIRDRLETIPIEEAFPGVALPSSGPAMVDRPKAVPETLATLFAEERGWALSQADRIVRLYSWRWGATWEIASTRQVLSQDYLLLPGEWFSLPGGGLKVIIGRSSIQPKYRPGEEIAALVANGVSIPLGHELLAEAEVLEHQAPRSSLMLSVAALEVGFKNVVSELVVEARWLMEEIPSPPLARMLTEYLPKLPLAEVASPPSALAPRTLEEVRKAVQMRNKLSHQGVVQIDQQWLPRWITLCRDLLYLFDAYTGNSWAVDRISLENRDRLLA